MDRLATKRILFSTIAIGAIGLLAAVLFDLPAMGQDSPQKAASTFRVVGYLPDYRVNQIDVSVGQSLTDLVFFSVAPEPRGEFTSKVLDSPKTVALLKRFREEQQVNLILCVGGWARSQGFIDIAAAEEPRREFAKGLTAYCLVRGFSGADIDWEHPKDRIESENYGRLMAEIALSFKPHGLKLSAAIAAWQTLTPEWIKAVDAVHLMSYDSPGKHSTLETAKADVRKLIDHGVPLGKIRLGVPFYGRGIKDRQQVKTYAEIYAANPNSVDQDEVNGIYFNGPSTIRAKMQFAKEHKLGGVMVWEIGQDAVGDAALLKVIHAAVK